MKEENKKEELQSRRDFFRKAAKTALPIIGAMVIGQSLLTSCDEDDEPDGCKNGCSGNCQSSCSGDCDGGCTNNCDSLCGGDCWSYCESTARS